MLLTYVDESYSSDAYYIAALMVPEREAISLTDALDAVVAKAAVDHEVSTTAELHGHDLFQAKAEWTHLEKKPRVRIGVYNAAFQAIADHDVKIVIRGVDVIRLKRRYTNAHHPHSVVLTHLIERVNECAARQDELALLISDEISKQDQYRRELGEYQKVGTWGYRATQITHIVDTMHFAPSRASRLVQAADLIAFLHRRRCSEQSRKLKGHTMDERALRANQMLWDRIKPKVVHQNTWCP
ncbi:DUF3800 domain-containing protein [Nocardiopsis sp. NPDC049922]|uniref:DUF3800 domain-containing protein n=1 Tax=Nocardiopsis sp. NPDC049922 TaxID=3155157 RepID=UPI0033E4B85A